MKIKFYGVRGSTPVPGKNTVKYGGNTACIKLENNNQDFIILDAGTGIRLLGNEIIHSTMPIYLMLSHNHWDHIQGFPFFNPIYQTNRVIKIIAGNTDLNEPDAILNQMKGSFFPVEPSALMANIEIEKPSCTSWQHNDFFIKRATLNHPGGGSAYRISVDGFDVVYANDNELRPPSSCKQNFDDWVSFVKDADYLIHDGQYLPSDYPFKLGWGHSLIKDALELAETANVKALVITSHDPIRSDQELDTILKDLKSMHLPFEIYLAYEGMVLS
jgi:phosphoribosyl 1,2-cyclic phosphodiesterase